MILSVPPLPALTDNILDSLLPDETPSLNTKWFRKFQLPHLSTSSTSCAVFERHLSHTELARYSADSTNAV
ncbi:hypothetical protein G6F60_001038 [Rhizopus arrhizus]|nr:hypothetical protein G6F60_001038 [Rhizopus arrhizus]